MKRTIITAVAIGARSLAPRGDDTLMGTDGNDVICGLKGNDTTVPRTSDQKNGPRPNSVMSESAIANARIGPSTSRPLVISFRAPTRAPRSANPAIARSNADGTRVARSAAVLANSAIDTPAATGRYTDR